MIFSRDYLYLLSSLITRMLPIESFYQAAKVSFALESFGLLRLPCIPLCPLPRSSTSGLRAPLFFIYKKRVNAKLAKQAKHAHEVGNTLILLPSNCSLTTGPLRTPAHPFYIIKRVWRGHWGHGLAPWVAAIKRKAPFLDCTLTTLWSVAPWVAQSRKAAAILFPRRPAAVRS
jgi:hypothetical protein